MLLHYFMLSLVILLTNVTARNYSFVMIFKLRICPFELVFSVRPHFVLGSNIYSNALFMMSVKIKPDLLFCPILAVVPFHTCSCHALFAYNVIDAQCEIQRKGNDRVQGLALKMWIYHIHQADLGTMPGTERRGVSPNSQNKDVKTNGTLQQLCPK